MAFFSLKICQWCFHMYFILFFSIRCIFIFSMLNIFLTVSIFQFQNSRDIWSQYSTIFDTQPRDPAPSCFDSSLWPSAQFCPLKLTPQSVSAAKTKTSQHRSVDSQHRQPLISLHFGDRLNSSALPSADESPQPALGRISTRWTSSAKPKSSGGAPTGASCGTLPRLVSALPGDPRNRWIVTHQVFCCFYFFSRVLTIQSNFYSIGLFLPAAFVFFYQPFVCSEPRCRWTMPRAQRSVRPGAPRRLPRRSIKCCFFGFSAKLFSMFGQ